MSDVSQFLAGSEHGGISTNPLGRLYIINRGPGTQIECTEKVDKDLHPPARQLTHAGTGKEMQAHHNSGQVGP